MKSAGKVYKGGIGEIVSSPDSSSTIWKSCTTFGRRNYLLRLSQILENQRHLSGREHSLRGAVVRFFQGFGQSGVRLYPESQTVEGCIGTNVGSVGLGQLTLVIRSDAVFHFDV